MHSNVGACTLFAATSGSSVATAATIGTVAINQIDKYGYNERLFLGSLASGGTLGILIPPSINMIVYGVLTNTSIPDLYLAGVIPGLILAGVFSLTIILACFFRPGFGGRKLETNWKKRIDGLPDLIPPLVIFAIVIGSIYFGLATPTESAALGVVGALALSALRGGHGRKSDTNGHAVNGAPDPVVPGVCSVPVLGRFAAPAIGCGGCRREHCARASADRLKFTL
jgi:tripartite ATP-independent transporter DctM subunit